MKKYRRIKKSDEFQKIIKSKQFVVSPSLVLYHVTKKTTDSRIGISVGKKLGNAVVRNLCKRQVRMMVCDCIQMVDDCDYIILIRADYLQYSFEDNKKQLENLHKKVKIRRYKGEKHENSYE